MDTNRIKESIVNAVKDIIENGTPCTLTNKYFAFHAEPDDCVCLVFGEDWMNPSDAIVERMVRLIPEEFKEHFIGVTPAYGDVTFEDDKHKFSSFEPVFSDGYQDKFKEMYDKYIAQKAAWCSKYGYD